MTQPVPVAKSARYRWVPLAIVLIVAVAGAVALRDYLSFETLRTHREALLDFRDDNYLGTVAGFMAIYILIVAFSLPGATVASLTGGFLFAVFPGTLINMLAATTGASLIFLAARMGLGQRLAARMSTGDGMIRRIKDGIDENQWSMLFLLRLLPAVPFFVANLIPALMGVPLNRFVITTFLGIIPGALVLTSVGAGLGEVFERGGTPDLGIFFEPMILLPVLGLCLLALLPVIVKLFRGRKGI